MLGLRLEGSRKSLRDAFERSQVSKLTDGRISLQLCTRGQYWMEISRQALATFVVSAFWDMYYLSNTGLDYACGVRSATRHGQVGVGNDGIASKA